MRKSRLSWSVQRCLMEHFVAGATARTAASLVGVHKTTAAFYFHRLREIIAQQRTHRPCSARSKSTKATSAAIARASVGEDAAGKIPVFGLLKRGGKVYAKVIPDVKSKTLKAIIDTKIVPDSIVHSDTLNSYNVLDVSAFKHLRINQSELFADQKNHINGIENFWNQVKRHMRRFNGIPGPHFHLFLKECEWKFNNPNQKAANPIDSMDYKHIKIVT